MFEDQNFLTFYLIQPLSWGGEVAGLRRGSRQKGLQNRLQIGFSIVNNFKKKKNVTKKIYIIYRNVLIL